MRSLVPFFLIFAILRSPKEYHCKGMRFANSINSLAGTFSLLELRRRLGISSSGHIRKLPLVDNPFAALLTLLRRLEGKLFLSRQLFAPSDNNRCLSALPTCVLREIHDFLVIHETEEMQGNEVGRQQLLLFGTAAVLRLALVVAFPALPNFLSGRVEISTPVTSFKRCMSARDASKT